ncbi:MAG: hypothetical protein US42_C0010G0017 [Candidatus Magasanikbacteria bacterium GW2011_GWC2_37_14]|uniref:Lipoprotein n=1 Tax=Candidatus Magasanikbacteria bacterium GW2011_GWC2_37_14 TaxID=1619046 RepID=A0A0G0GMI5_9BACT|nr:MAG: hypothetical protein US42_C0010G0017 [Candidatus Magasanikbacteria bacterium GW2011_GWC2_37_14]
MKKNILVGLLIINLFLSGCALNSGNEKFVLTTEPQDAEFYIANGWTGGMGSMPILNKEKTGTLQYENLPVYFDESQNEIISAKLPSCYEGRPEIKVSAKIQLEKKSGVNYSLPPTEDETIVEESYYEAKVLELKNIEVKATECRD